MRDPTVVKMLDSALVEIDSKPTRTPRFPGDREALDRPLNDDEKKGYAKAVEEMRKAIFGDKDEAREAAVAILDFVPGFYPEGAKHEDGRDQDPDGEFDPCAWENCSFFSEHYLYNLFGKDTARSILGRLHGLMDAVGIVHWKLGPELNKLDEERKERHERQRAYRARQREKKAKS